MKVVRIFLLVLIIIGVALLATQKTWVPKLVDMILRYEGTDVTHLVNEADYKNISYIIDGQSVTLVNGHAEAEAVPGSASKTITQYFGNEAVGDLNADGLADTAFLLTQNGGGSGTFYYVVVALKTKDGYIGSNAVLLGDRIAPQATEIRDGVLTVNYADRKKDEPMTATPSVGVSKHLKVQGTTLVEEKQ
jgi:hypothetical protein